MRVSKYQFPFPPGYEDRPRAIDAFSCDGGASAGLVRAGFRVIGIEKDAKRLRYYPFEVVHGDVIELLSDVVAQYRPAVVVGSPPCQLFSDTQVIQGNEHPDLITPFRALVQKIGLPYWIENVRGAVRQGFLRPDVMLCGLMFGLQTDRHRFFELNFAADAPPHPYHPGGKTKMGRAFADGQLRQYVGHFHGPAAAREDLGTPWMSRQGMAECIPPAYGEYLGRQLMRQIRNPFT